MCVRINRGKEEKAINIHTHTTPPQKKFWIRVQFPFQIRKLTKKTIDKKKIGIFQSINYQTDTGCKKFLYGQIFHVVHNYFTFVLFISLRLYSTSLLVIVYIYHFFGNPKTKKECYTFVFRENKHVAHFCRIGKRIEIT